MRITYKIFLAITGAVFFIVGCGDDIVPARTSDGYTGEENERSNERSSESDRDSLYTLEILNKEPLDIPANESSALSIRLLYDWEPVTDEIIHFTVTGDPVQSRLSSSRSRTDSYGIARTFIHAGEPGIISILVENENIEPYLVYLNVLPSENRRASLRVLASYPDQSYYPADSIVVTVYYATYNCEDLHGRDFVRGLATSSMEIDGSAYFNGFGDGQTVTVRALANNQRVNIAEGCMDGVVLDADNETRLIIPLERRKVEAAGNYYYSTSIDTGNLIPGSAGELIGVMGSLFEHSDDPARFLVNLIEEKAGFSFGFMHGTVVNYLDSMLRNVIPERFFRLFEFVSDAARIVSGMRFEGELKIYNDENGNLVAEEFLDTVIFKWRAGCDPLTRPGCDEHKVLLRNTHIGDLVYNYGVEKDDYTLVFETHQRNIEYASFYHVFLTNVVYPYIMQGANGTGDILLGMIDCADVAKYIDRSDGVEDGYYTLGFASISVDTIENTCVIGLESIGRYIDGYIHNLTTDNYGIMTIEGSSFILDASKDLQADRLINGNWLGSIEVDGINHDVSGSFSAEKIDERIR